MATETVADRVKKTTASIDGIYISKRKTKWLVMPNAPKTADELPFASRDVNGRMVWWDVTLPKTDYWNAHQILGRAYAFELLDLLNHPEGDYPEHILAYIVADQMRWRGTDPCGGAIIHGFHEVVSEFLATGSAKR